ncbi:MAG TPA: zinc ribbon domain-containing protein [Thermoanaerobaculia bacterium]|nr:zinc ribbon domain-containing protein [Thermoanaerobaculia bacterium]
MSNAPLEAKARKFPCESCGADVRWDPGALMLKCPYCGHQKAIATPQGRIEEHSVDAALRAPRDLGWGAERKVIICKKCGAHTTLDPHIAASSCAFCGTAAVVDAPPNPNVVRPEGLLAFKIARTTAIGQFRSWLASLWLRPNDLSSKSRLTTMQGVYVPFWTFDAATNSRWTADAGYHYYESVTVYENGRQVERQEQRTRWEPASGNLTKFFDDIPIPASNGMPPYLAKDIEPFPTAELTPYDPAFLSGFLAEENAIDLPEALQSAKKRMSNEIRSECISQIPGDTYRDLVVDTTFSALAYKNALLPIWIAAYEYGSKAYRYIVNGVTGKAAGTAPFSWVKVTLLTMAILAIVLVVMYAKNQ